MKRLYKIGLALSLSAAVLAGAATASAQPPEGPGGLERGYGMGYDSFDNPISVGTRDENGNRLIVDGRLMPTSSLSGGLMDSASGLGSAQAIGNQLTVVTQGSWNTVIVDSTQINTGDISAEVTGVN